MDSFFIVCYIVIGTLSFNKNIQEILFQIYYLASHWSLNYADLLLTNQNDLAGAAN